MFGLPQTDDLPLVLHTNGEDPTASLAAALQSGRVGVDKFWYAKFLLGLMVHRKDISPFLGSNSVDIARTCKDEDECSAMRKSYSCNNEVMAAAISALKAGVCENEIASLVNREYLLRGRTVKASS